MKPISNSLLIGGILAAFAVIATLAVAIPREASAASLGQKEQYKVAVGQWFNRGELNPAAMEADLNRLAAEGWTVRVALPGGGFVLAR